MSDPIEHDLRDRALPGVGLAGRFVVDRQRQAVLRAGAVGQAAGEGDRARGGAGVEQADGRARKG